MNITLLLLIWCPVCALPAPTSLPANAAQVSSKVEPRNSAGLPRPAVAPHAGTWKYESRDDIPANPHAVNNHSTSSLTIKENGGSWTFSTALEFPEGPVTDILTLDKDTLALRKEVFRHFLHRDQPWKPIAVDVDIRGDKVSGVMKYVSGKDRPFAVGVSGPVFAIGAIEATVGCLPLADGYSTSFRYFDIERLALNPQAPDREKELHVKVLGAESVTVRAGTFDAWKVELSAPDGTYQETLWIARDSRTPVKSYAVQKWRKGAREGTSSYVTELVP